MTLAARMGFLPQWLDQFRFSTDWSETPLWFPASAIRWSTFDLSGQARNAGGSAAASPAALSSQLHNAGKLSEIGELLRPFGLATVGAGRDARSRGPRGAGGRAFATTPCPRRATATAPRGCSALADDSGLCVEALDGVPGVYSARWAGLDEGFWGRDGPFRTRTGSARRASAVAGGFRQRHRRSPGRWRGRSFRGSGRRGPRFPPRGTAGFGYDPIFRPDGHDRTFGEMSAEEKHGIPLDGSFGPVASRQGFPEILRAPAFNPEPPRVILVPGDWNPAHCHFQGSVLGDSRDLRLHFRVVPPASACAASVSCAS